MNLYTLCCSSIHLLLFALLHLLWIRHSVSIDVSDTCQVNQFQTYFVLLFSFDNESYPVLLWRNHFKWIHFSLCSPNRLLLEMIDCITLFVDISYSRPVDTLFFFIDGQTSNVKQKWISYWLKSQPKSFKITRNMFEIVFV